MYYNDIYNRKINIGDYILVNPTCNRPIDLSALKLMQVPSFVPIDCSIECYKIENPTHEFIQMYTQIDNNFGNKTDVYRLNEIFGRDLVAGDFVLALVGTNNFIKKNVYYGMVIDNKHILTLNGIIKKIPYVFKLDSLITEEEEIYKKLVYYYRDYQQRSIQNVNKELEVGDVFEKNKILYIYFGEYVFNAMADDNVINFSPEVKKYMNEYQKVFLRIDKTTKKSLLFYESLKNGSLTTKGMSDYIASCSLSSYVIKSLGLPNCYIFNVSKKRLGVFKENIAINFPPYSVFDTTYNNIKKTFRLSFLFYD